MQEWSMTLGSPLRLRTLVVALCLGGVSLVACSNASSMCSEASSIAGFTMQFSQGLDNFSETQFSILRDEAFAARKIVNDVAILDPESIDAAELGKKINVFISSMETNDWDISLAISDADAVTAALRLGLPESLTQANTVEALVIGECGLPSVVVNSSQTFETLPGPSIPSPTQTEPPTNTINEASQDDALGATIAQLFNLTVSPAQSSCLGEALQGVVDVSSSNANLAQYQGQFQRAFDQCSIAFTVPTE
jgi:hypothetical protein